MFHIDEQAIVYIAARGRAITVRLELEPAIGG